MNRPFPDLDADSELAGQLAERLGAEPSLEELIRQFLERADRYEQPLRLLTFPELKARKGIDFSRRYIDLLEAKGEFPRRRQLGGNSVAWVESEIDTWIESLPKGFIRDGRIDRGKAGLEQGRTKRRSV